MSSSDTPGWFQMIVLLAAVTRQQLDRQGTRELWQRGWVLCDGCGYPNGCTLRSGNFLSSHARMGVARQL